MLARQFYRQHCDMKNTLAFAWLMILTTFTSGSLLKSAAAEQVCPGSFLAALLRLIPCRSALTPFIPGPPSDACCNSVKLLGQPCLCAIAAGPPISGVDRNMVLLLPSKCAVEYQPCTISGNPVIQAKLETSEP